MKLNEKLPLLWRSPNSVQIGFDRPIVTLTRLPDSSYQMLNELKSGISQPGLEMIANKHKISEPELTELVQQLQPALKPEQSQQLSLSISGEAEWVKLLTPHLSELIQSSPVEQPVSQSTAASSSAEASSAAGASPSTAANFSPNFSANRTNKLLCTVICESFFAKPERAASLLSQNQIHLSLVVSDQSVTIGPLVIPGVTPCLYCVNLAKNSADPNWSVLASQLSYPTRPVQLSSKQLYQAVAEIYRQIDQFNGALNELTPETNNTNQPQTTGIASRSVQIFQDGTVLTNEYQFAEECFCHRELDSEI